MPVDRKKYDDIIQRIYLQRDNFYRRIAAEPNIVILNDDDYNTLLDTNAHILNKSIDSKNPTVFGMPIQRKRTGNIQVGYVVEEVPPNQ